MKNFLGSRALPDMIYHRPKDMDELLRLMKDVAGELKIIAGCTDFIPSIRGGKWFFDDGLNVVDIKGLKELSFIRKDGDTIMVGAATRLADIIRSPIIQEHAPVLAEAVKQMASPQVRNSATIGGNLCTASPAADTAPPLLVLDAKVKIQGADSEQTMPLEKFFLGPGSTLMKPREILTEIHFPAMKPGEASRRLRMGSRDAFVCSIISVATWIKVNNGTFDRVRIALGAVAPTPVRITKAEDHLSGKETSPEMIAEGAKLASEQISPITDLRASAAYRKDLAYTLTKRVLTACVNDLK
jgi:carbon-monoxide dehydrogenase medium subunit